MRAKDVRQWPDCINWREFSTNARKVYNIPCGKCDAPVEFGRTLWRLAAEGTVRLTSKRQWELVK